MNRSLVLPHLLEAGGHIALTCAIATSAWAQAPLVADLEVVATRYHENPARLDAVSHTASASSPWSGSVRGSNG